MNAVSLVPHAGVLNASMRVPGSKSIANRALVCAALATGESMITNPSDSDDTARMINGLNQLGILVRTAGDGLHVEGAGGRLFAPKVPIPVGNAGTTFRFLLGAAALARGTTTFELSPRMAERPLDDLTESLAALGVAVERDPSGLFVRVHGGGLTGGTVRLKAARSSQFLSSLLLAAPLASSPVQIEIVDAVSSMPYVAMTTTVMRAFGVEVSDRKGKEFIVPAPASYRPASFLVEPDASGASYPFAIAALLRGCMTVEGIRESSLQGDARFLDVLRRMGCCVTAEGRGVRVEGNVLHGLSIDMNAMPDIVPTLTAVALFAEGPTRISNVAHLRFKESNRLDTMAGELRKLGANIAVLEDGLAITPVPLHGAVLSTHDDHRLAMSFALIGLRVPGVVIENPDCVRKSYPMFWKELEAVAEVREA